MCLAIGPAPKWHFVPRLPSGSPKIPKVEIPATLGFITLYVNLPLRWGLKKSCSFHRELSNSMSHATCRHGNQGDSWLLMVGSQIVNLTFALLLAITCVWSFQIGHASPFETSTLQEFFHDIKNVSIQWVLTPTIFLWRFRSPLGLQFPKWEFT
jgi:hypothetical protein